MNIFTDYHHDGLITSLYLLLEGRLGHSLYRPIGMEWFEKGFWAINQQEDTAKQYLSIESIPKDRTRRLNKVFGTGAQYMEIQGFGSNHKAITFEQFLNMDIDVIIASIPQHIEPFKRLIREYKPNCKLVLQVGNDWAWETMDVNNVLCSTAPRETHGKHVVFYHQEFDRKIFKPVFKEKKKVISTFINVLDEKPRDYGFFIELERIMPDWKFNMYGAQNRDGSLTDLRQIASEMQKSAFVFHCKTGGDGFGHVIWNTAFCGTPIITRYADYKGKLAEALIDEDSAILVDGKSPKEVAAEINDKYSYCNDHGRAIYSLAKQSCDFKHDAKLVHEWLNNLL